MEDIYKNIKEYNSSKKWKILIVFYMIADMLVFIIQSYFAVPKNIRLNSRHYFFMKLPNKRELQQIAFNHSSDIDFWDLMNLYKSVLQNHILFWLLILLFHQIILYVLERIFEKEYRS